MAQSNHESDDLTRKESAKQLEANNNTDNGENNNNDGEDEGLVNLFSLTMRSRWSVYFFEPTNDISQTNEIFRFKEVWHLYKNVATNHHQ